MSKDTTISQKLPLSRASIRTLSHEEGGLRFSLYVPLEKANDQERQNIIRLKDMRKSAEETLYERGVDENGILQWLAPIDAWLNEPTSLQRTCGTLALFISGEEVRMMELPEKTKGIFHAGSRFYLLPLMPYLEADRVCWVLSLSQRTVELRRCGLEGSERVHVPGMPSSIEAITQVDDPERSVQHHTSVTRSGKGQAGSHAGAVVHGQGMPENLRDDQEDRYYRQVAKAVSSFFAGKSVSLLLIGDENSLGRFRSHTDLSRHHVQPNKVHPREYDPALIESLAKQLLMAAADEERENLRERIASAPPEKTMFTFSAAIPAAREGRVEACIVSRDRSRFVEVQEDETGQVMGLASDQGTDCSHEADDYLAQATVRSGGRVFTGINANIDGEEGVAVLLRY